MYTEGIAEGLVISRLLCGQPAKPQLLVPRGDLTSLSNLRISVGRMGPGGEGSRALDLWELCLKLCLVSVTLAEIPTGTLRIGCEWKGET